ncbi:MAG: hypothetical protein AB2792_13405 [Candidatus Thiodiazotropha sp.]
MKTEVKSTSLIIGDQPIVFSFPDEDHALMLSLGAALAQIQAFETSIAFILSNLASKSKDKENQSLEDAMKVNMEKTLGRLVKHFLLVLKNKEIADLLEEVRSKRNHIVHNILRAYGWPMMSPQKYIEAIQEIDGFRGLLSDAEPIICKHLSDKEKMNIRLLTLDPLTGDVDIKV